MTVKEILEEVERREIAAGEDAHKNGRYLHFTLAAAAQERQYALNELRLWIQGNMSTKKKVRK